MGKPNPSQSPMSNLRTKWMQEVVESALNCDQSAIAKCFDVNSESIAVWLKSGANESRMYFFETDRNSIECSSSSPTLSGNAVYFLRNSSKAINLKTWSDNSLLTGNMSKKSLIPILQSCISNVYSPIILTTNEWDKISINKEKQFSELLATSINNLDHGITIELPNKQHLTNIDPNDNFDELIEDTESMNIIRETVIKWIENIYEFLCQTNDEINSGPKQEINFWSKRNLVLTKSYQLLLEPAYRGIIAVLQQDAEEEAERNGTSLVSDDCIDDELSTPSKEKRRNSSK